MSTPAHRVLSGLALCAHQLAVRMAAIAEQRPVLNRDEIDGRVVVSTVAEPFEPYSTETLWLFSSLRLFGGAASAARCVAYFVDRIPADVASALAKLRVECRITPPSVPGYPHANKLGMLAQCPSCNYLLAVDTDVVICGDFSPFLQGGAIAAKPADDERLTPCQWNTLYNYLQIQRPADRYLSSFGMQEMPPYFNSGVIVVPGARVADLYLAWLASCSEIWKAYDGPLQELATVRLFTDQFAFSGALLRAGLAYRALPARMNFATHYPTHPALLPDSIEPLVLHHHHRLDARGLMLTGYAAPDAAIRRVNAAVGSLMKQFSVNSEPSKP